LWDTRGRLLEEVARQIPASRSADCVRVAVDGVDGAGKTMFADELASFLRAGGRPVIRVSADGFHHRRAIRYTRGRDSPLGFWLDSYDYDSLRTEVLEPLGPGGSRRYLTAVHDVDSDETLDLPVRHADPGSVLILDGLFLHRDELAVAGQAAERARADDGRTGQEQAPHPSSKAFNSGNQSADPVAFRIRDRCPSVM